MAKYCIMCGDRIATAANERCTVCWDMHRLIERNVKLASKVYDKMVLEAFYRRNPIAFHQTLIELE